MEIRFITGKLATRGSKALTVCAGLMILVLFSVLTGGCYIPGVGALSGASGGKTQDPPLPGGPGNIPYTYYGKFFIYQAGNGAIWKISGEQYSYIVGENFHPGAYYPINGKDNFDDYNIFSLGNGQLCTGYDKDGYPICDYTPARPVDNPNVEQQKFFYRDQDLQATLVSRSGSDHPEAIVLNDQLSFFYTNPPFDYQVANSGVFDNIAEDDIIPDDPSGAVFFALNSFFYGGFQHDLRNGNDIDWYEIDADHDNLLIIARVSCNRLRGCDEIEPRMTLYDSDMNELAASEHSLDFWRYKDPVISYVLPQAGTYYLKMSDSRPTHIACSQTNDFSNGCQYQITLDAPAEPISEGFSFPGRLMKAEIQAAPRNPKLDGGPTFEPDDLNTKILDELPDCDGIPGSGDEGDWGIYELCGDHSENTGSRDGRMQYEEVDDKSTIDDGEWFKGIETNIPAYGDEAPTVIKHPDEEKLMMWVTYGSRIYQIESLDGYIGLNWDLSNIFYDRPSLLPGGNPNPKAPVVSSGIYGFCDTTPDLESDDTYPDPRMDLSVYPGPRGYPDSIAINHGGNGWLDSYPMIDTEQNGNITSGPDGILNTYFIPGALYYAPLPGYHQPVNAETVTYIDAPGNPEACAILGTCPPCVQQGNCDALTQASLDVYDQHAFLLGDDIWNPDYFGPGTGHPYPAQYFRQQYCGFFTMGLWFNQCALGVPDTISIKSGKNGNLDTVDDVLARNHGDDVLCHEGDKVGVCTGPDGQLDLGELYMALGGDDQLDICTDYYIDPDTNTLQTEQVVCVAPGPDGVLDTDINNGWISMFSHGPYYALMPVDPQTIAATGLPLVDLPINGLAGDRICCDQAVLDVYSPGNVCPPRETQSICPTRYVQKFEWKPVFANVLSGNINFLSSFFIPVDEIQEVRMLTSVWPLYFGTGEKDAMMDLSYFRPDLGLPPNSIIYQMHPYAENDTFSFYDDEFCLINNQLAVCPGPNGYFQGFFMSYRLKVDQGGDPTVLWENNKELMEKPCYYMDGMVIKNDFTGHSEMLYVLWYMGGVRNDDQIHWDEVNGYYITTGQNGINQSCFAGGDELLIPHNQGAPYMDIILPGENGVLDTYALQDGYTVYDKTLWKVTTGDDGIANSYILGDDKQEIFFGTGAADFPCVSAGPDGIADTAAMGNDKQLFRPGEETGFDAYWVGAPDVIRDGDKLYMFYTALGWDVLPKITRKNKGDYDGLGECRRTGFDKLWGDRNFSLIITGTGGIKEDDHKLNMLVLDGANINRFFARSLDDNPDVILAPRIGLATSTVHRVEADPGDWDKYPKAVVDMGDYCGQNPSFLIDLGTPMGSQANAFNYSGTYSPDVLFYTEPSDGTKMFIMFATGMQAYEAIQGTEDNISSIGLLQSVNGTSFIGDRHVNPVIALESGGVNALLSAIMGLSDVPNYANPGVFKYPDGQSYGMFFKEFKPILLNEGIIGFGSGINTNFPMEHHSWITYGLRTGVSYYLMCSVSGNNANNIQDKSRAAIQLIILGLPLITFIGFRVLRRKKNA